MPNARDHSVITILAAIAAGLMASMYVGAELALVGVASAILGDLFLSPDLDHHAGSLAFRMWGPLRFIWEPYARILPHRSVVSHFPLIGTAGRLIYLAAIAAPFVWLFELDALTAMAALRSELIAALVGLELSNSLHFLADRLR